MSCEIFLIIHQECKGIFWLDFVSVYKKLFVKNFRTGYDVFFGTFFTFQSDLLSKS